MSDGKGRLTVTVTRLSDSQDEAATSKLQARSVVVEEDGSLNIRLDNGLGTIVGPSRWDRVEIVRVRARGGTPRAT